MKWDYKLGFFFTCFNEKQATEESLKSLRIHYKNNPIYLTSEGFDFKYLRNMFDNIIINQSNDTMSNTFKITDTNFKENIHQENIKICIMATLDRLKEAIKFCNSEYLLMMEPDTLIRGPLHIPDNVVLLGSRVNIGLPQEVRTILSNIEGAKIINQWGATPGLFRTDRLLVGIDKLLSIPNLLNDLCNSFYAMYAHDVLIPIIFAIVGDEETFNPDIIECKRNTNWSNTTNPLVHQWKIY
jgi:hypothetical protein